MSDNILQTLQQLVQDVIAPDVRELKVRVTALEKQMDVRFNAIEQRLDSLDQKADARFDAIEKTRDAQFNALLSAISESRAQAELTNLRVIAALSERVAVLEAQRH
jgi:capsule polysaccharide export protein KpsE/RkpR